LHFHNSCIFREFHILPFPLISPFLHFCLLRLPSIFLNFLLQSFSPFSFSTYFLNFSPFQTFSILPSSSHSDFCPFINNLPFLFSVNFSFFK
jgi:hypothetical protein